MQLTEIFHSYDDPEHLDFKARKPLKHGDTVRVFHGFRDLPDAVRAARAGLSGRDRADRVYSYESDNNPYGLFVTTSIEVAKKFTNAVIMEFVASYDELEAPVWPGGSYTVQGQMSQYWGHGRAGMLARRHRQRELAQEPPSEHIPEIHGSDDSNLASTLLASGERQALFVGHLDPERIVAFHVKTDPHYKEPWTKFNRDAFLARTADEKPKYDYERGSARVMKPNDTFDAATFLRLMSNDHRDMAEQMPRVANMVFELPASRRKREFLSLLGPYLWPKQYADAFNWLYRTYGKKSDDG